MCVCAAVSCGVCLQIANSKEQVISWFVCALNCIGVRYRGLSTSRWYKFIGVSLNARALLQDDIWQSEVPSLPVRDAEPRVWRNGLGHVLCVPTLSFTCVLWYSCASFRRITTLSCVTKTITRTNIAFGVKEWLVMLSTELHLCFVVFMCIFPCPSQPSRVKRWLGTHNTELHCVPVQLCLAQHSPPVGRDGLGRLAQPHLAGQHNRVR